MLKDHPDHHDAELVLKLYELRREPVMRESRSAMSQWFPTTVDDVLAVTTPEHPLNAAFRQVSSYWEMAFAMARHDVLHADFMAELSGEGLYFYARIEPFVDDYRKVNSPRAFRNAEWAAKNTETGREMMPVYRARIEKRLAGG